MEIGQKIKQLREELGFTQKQLSIESHVSEISIRKYESGDRQPKIEQLTKIANALNVEVNELLPYHITIGNESTLPPELKPLDKSYSKASTQILADLEALNDKGQYEAAKRVHELTKLDEYTNKEGE